MNNSLIPPSTETKRGMSATTILAALLWVFSEREDLGDPVIAIVAVSCLIGLVITLLVGRKK